MESTGQYNHLGDLTLIDVSVVPPSKCGVCRVTMAPASDTKWKCKNEACANNGKPVYTGVHPVFMSKR